MQLTGPPGVLAQPAHSSGMHQNPCTSFRVPHSHASSPEKVTALSAHLLQLLCLRLLHGDVSVAHCAELPNVLLQAGQLGLRLHLAGTCLQGWGSSSGCNVCLHHMCALPLLDRHCESHIKGCKCHLHIAAGDMVRAGRR